MKKSKILSLFTSLAVVGAAALSTLSFSASALDNPVGLAMTSDKTEFSIEDVKSGKAKAEIYVDITTKFDKSAQVAVIEFELRPETWGTTDPKNLEILEPNVLGTDDLEMGNFPSIGYETGATLAGSEWTSDAKMPGSLHINFGSVPAYKSPTEWTPTSEGEEYPYPPKIMALTNSACGYFSTNNEYVTKGEHFAKFDVILPEDLPEGEYTINFNKAKAFIGAFGDAESCNITDAKGITITVSEDGGDDDDFLLGDANLDKKVNVRDCACIANALAKSTVADLPQKNSDYNQDGTINVRDAAALAKDIATGKIAK